MNDAVVIALPARQLSLSLTVGPPEGVTTLEDFVARAIRLGCSTLEKQRKLFCLDERLLLDAVYGLWTKGYVIVDFATGHLDLSDGARELLGKRRSLADSVVDTIKKPFLYEPVTGKILLEGRGLPRPSSAYSQLPLSQESEATDLPQLELLRVVSALYARDRDASFRSRVLSVNFGSPALRLAAELRWVHVRVSVRQDADSGRYSFLIEDDDVVWDNKARQRLSDHLADFIEREPDHRFSRRLARAAASELTAPDTADQLLDQLIALLPGMEVLSGEAARERQASLAEIAARIDERLTAEDRLRVAAVPVLDAEGRLWAVEKLIREADQQVVICAPTIHYDSLNRLIDTLLPALEKGLRVIVLWGRRPNESLADKVRAAFDDLRQKYPHQVLVPVRSATTNACFVVQDDRRAWVGSHSPLDPPRNNPLELSMLIESAPLGVQRPEAVLDLLLWARKAYPYWQSSQLIAVDPEDFDGDAPAEPGSGEKQLVVPPLSDTALHQADSIRMWAATWAEYPGAVSRIRNRSSRVGPGVQVLADGQHTDLMWSQLRRTHSRVVIGDERNDITALPEALRRVLLDKLGTGVRLDFAVPAPGQDPDWLAEFADRGARVARRSAPRGFVADDTVVIGSVSPFPGVMAANPTTSAPSELGLALTGHQVAGRVAAAIVPSWDARAAETAAAEPATDQATYSAAAIALPLLQEARKAAAFAPSRASRREFGRVVRERLTQLDDPWQIFSVWRKHKVSDVDLRPLAAALLTLPRDDHTEPATRGSVLSWMLLDAWRGGRFVEAAVLAAAEPDLCDTPSALACATAAPVEFGPVVLPWNEIVPAVVPGDAVATVAATGALADVLLWGEFGALEPLRALLDRAAFPTSWQRIALAAIEYAQVAPAPLPVEPLAALVSTNSLAEAGEAEWARLAEEVARIGQSRRFNLKPGQRLQQRLSDSDGLLTAINAACRGAPEERTHMMTVLPANIREYCDDIVAQECFPPMAWSRHRAFLNGLEDVIRRARVLGAHSLAGVDPLGRELSRPTRDFARQLGDENWRRLRGEADAVPAPYLLPVQALLTRLEPVAQWARMS